MYSYSSLSRKVRTGTPAQRKRASKKIGRHSAEFGKRHGFPHITVPHKAMSGKTTPKQKKLIGAHPLHSDKVHASTGARLIPKPSKPHVHKPYKPPKGI